MFALCYGLYSCSPHWYDHLCFREALGAFTTELAHVRSPSHESVITTWVNRQLPGRDSHPLETQPYGAAYTSIRHVFIGIEYLVIGVPKVYENRRYENDVL